MRYIPTLKDLVETAHALHESRIIDPVQQKHLRELFRLAFRSPIKNPSLTQQAFSRLKLAHSTLQQALSAGSYLFLTLTLRVPIRNWSEPALRRFITSALNVDTSDVNFVLNSETIAMMENWARVDDFATSQYAHFMTPLRVSASPYNAVDLEWINKIINARGLTGTGESAAIMSVLFPEFMHPGRKLSDCEGDH